MNVIVPEEHHCRPEAIHLQSMKVRAVTLDDLCRDRLPDLIKIDVEGAELNVLQGAKELLGAGKTLFLVELDERGDVLGILGWMGTFGYRAMRFFDNTLFYAEGALGPLKKLRIYAGEVIADPRGSVRRLMHKVLRCH